MWSDCVIIILLVLNNKYLCDVYFLVWFTEVAKFNLGFTKTVCINFKTKKNSANFKKVVFLEIFNNFGNFENWPILCLADRTNGRAYATVLRLSVVCDVMYCG